ncbi:MULTISPECIES: hypothetical protein [Ralstonia]|jgi:hypothetical protein|nr:MULTISPECIES: hypothetical protein [Ralstonia]MDH6643399.1 hypothetical protein [Ralstonia sp. GP73]
MIDFLLEGGPQARAQLFEVPAVESQGRANWLWRESWKLSMAQ